jgi:putative ABC transport system permease protein
VFFLGGQTSWITLRLQPGMNTSEVLAKMKTAFHKVLPNVPFDYKFVDQEYARKFASEERVGQLALVFSTLAIFISCLGLFGLISFVAEQRTKEIGIRKIVGASTIHLWAMLSKDFLVLVAVSCLIAIPVADYFLSDWLSQFTYRTELSWWIFASASAAAITITLVTVSYQSIRAAMVNPVKSLRAE